METTKWECSVIRSMIDHNVREHDGYMPEGAIDTQSILIGYSNNKVSCVKFEDKYEESGYWHDNPNYPYRNISTTTILIDNPSQIRRLAQSIFVTDLTPEKMIENMKILFANQEEFVEHLNESNILYHRLTMP